MHLKHAESTSSSTVAALRLGTRSAHERLEATVDLRWLAESRDRYGEILAAFYGIYAVLEPKLWKAVPWSTLGLDPEPRRKLPRLREDLQDLNIDFTQLPLCSKVPGVSGPWQAVGVLYVLEGSTLGGKIINRELRNSLGLESRFFGSYGAAVGSMWRELIHAVDVFESGEGSPAEAIAAANETFILFEQHVSSSKRQCEANRQRT